MSRGINLIAAERERQITDEHWTPEHDDEHAWGELAGAAACYALPPERRRRMLGTTDIPEGWPWDDEWWKPCPADRVRELVKAGALIAAEIDRLLRLTPAPDSE